jgi:hypothetical protein
MNEMIKKQQIPYICLKQYDVGDFFIFRLAGKELAHGL